MSDNTERILGPGAAGDPEDPGDPSTPITEQSVRAQQLRGRELDEALEDAGLPKSGTVAEKRQRLAESPQAQHVVSDDDKEA